MTDLEEKELLSIVKGISTATQQLAEGLQHVNADLQSFKQEMTEFKQEMTEFKNETTTNFKVINEKITSVKNDMSNINQRINDTHSLQGLILSNSSLIVCFVSLFVAILAYFKH